MVSTVCCARQATKKPLLRVPVAPAAHLRYVRYTEYIVIERTSGVTNYFQVTDKITVWVIQLIAVQAQDLIKSRRHVGIAFDVPETWPLILGLFRFVFH